jgi:hypothetical protein
MSVKRITSLKLDQDPILTELAQGYENTIGASKLILPDVMVDKPQGKYPIFGKENLRVHDSKRAIKTPIKEMPVDNWTSGTFSVESHGLEASIDFEEIEAAGNLSIDLEQYTMNQIMESLALEEEYNAVQLLEDADNYPADNVSALTSGDEFNDYTEGNNPLVIMRDGMETIRNATNLMPNCILLSHSSYMALADHPVILERIKYSQLGILTTDLLSALLSTPDNKIKVAIGTGMYQDPTTGENVDLWGDVVVIAYNKRLKQGITRYDMSFGKNFILKGYPWGSRAMDRHGVISYIAALKRYKSYITNSSAGFLISGTIAAEG